MREDRERQTLEDRTRLKAHLKTKQSMLHPRSRALFKNLCTIKPRSDADSNCFITPWMGNVTAISSKSHFYFDSSDFNETRRENIIKSSRPTKKPLIHWL